MATAQRVRTHVTAKRICRFEEYVKNCTEIDAIITAATRVEWLATEPGRIIVAQANGQIICKVWNAKAFDDGVSAQFDGPVIDSPTIHRVGHYVIESVRPLKLDVRSHYITVEAPE